MLQENFSKVGQLEDDEQFGMVTINPLHNTMQQQQQQIVVNKLEGSLTKQLQLDKAIKSKAQTYEESQDGRDTRKRSVERLEISYRIDVLMIGLRIRLIL
ncbi:hypothetical protein A2U01_0040105 [Trifolium medium]|uniref:Uncharacterized protein n=1 Tax=Trifolium medium TaxID=97028 RepID=A0A392Q5F0_9FABA|nr:hypothetical protein [Trifolium medium]